MERDIDFAQNEGLFIEQLYLSRRPQLSGEKSDVRMTSPDAESVTTEKLRRLCTDTEVQELADEAKKLIQEIDPDDLERLIASRMERQP